MVMLSVWAVLAVVLCLSGEANTQLGEGESFDSHDQEEEEEEQKEEAWAAGGVEEEGGEEMVMMIPRRWKPLQETYLGCLKEDDNFTDSIKYVNLTEVMDRHELDSLEEACYQFCLNKAPLSLYLTMNLALNGSVDACGCHLDNELNLDNLVEDEGCDTKMDFYRVFCGPYNIKCFSRAGGFGPPSLPFLFLPLLLTLLSGLADAGPILPSRFGSCRYKGRLKMPANTLFR